MKPEKQLELNMIPRRRAVLVDDVASPNDGEPVSESEKYSPWKSMHEASPPEAGDWDIRDRARGLGVLRATYISETDMWVLPNWPFQQKCFGEWRGLASPPKGKRRFFL